MSRILDGVWTMLTAGDIGGVIAGIFLLILGLLLAPFLLIGNLLGLGL